MPSIAPDELVNHSNVAVVIVNYRTPELTKRCLAALTKERKQLPPLRAMVVDGGSADGSVDELADFISTPSFADWVELLPCPINGGFGWANNQGILTLMRKADPPEFIYLLNPDAEVLPRAVSLMVDFLTSRPEVGAVGSRLLHPDGSVAGSAFSFPTIRGEFGRGATTRLIERIFRIPPIAIEAKDARAVDWVTGASVMLRVEALRQVGLFDEGFFLYNEEVELMWRMRKAGWAVATEPRSLVRHVAGAATGVSDRSTEARIEPRKPAYLFRSRARFFGLTRGPAAAFGAYAAWLAGHAVWRLRRLLGVPIGKPVDRHFRDHLRAGFPRKQDFVAAAPTIDSEPGRPPAWMDRGWK